MKRMRAILGMAAGLATVAGATITRASDGAKAPVVWAAGDLKWVDSPSVPGARFAVLWGDVKTGPYGALRKIPGGAAIAAHTHSADQRVTMVSGTIALSIGGGAAKDMGSGSYLFMPAGQVHSATCKAGAECVYLEVQDGPADIKFVEPAKK